MDYAKSIPFTGDAGKSLDFALTVLAVNGFRLERREPDALTLTGPGMASSKQNAILAVSSIRLAAQGGEIALEADLGGLRPLRRVLVWLPVGMALFFLLFFGFLFGERGLFTPLIFAPWLILSPLLLLWLRRRALRALDALLTAVAGAGSQRM